MTFAGFEAFSTFPSFTPQGYDYDRAIGALQSVGDHALAEEVV